MAVLSVLSACLFAQFPPFQSEGRCVSGGEGVVVAAQAESRIYLNGPDEREKRINPSCYLFPDKHTYL